jgi:hypothetical protein
MSMTSQSTDIPASSAPPEGPGMERVTSYLSTTSYISTEVSQIPSFTSQKYKLHLNLLRRK